MIRRQFLTGSSTAMATALAQQQQPRQTQSTKPPKACSSARAGADLPESRRDMAGFTASARLMDAAVGQPPEE